MNKKQLITMWCGIGAFALLGVFWPPYSSLYIPSAIAMVIELLVRWAVVVVITGGLIYTFADKKPKDK